MGQVTHALLTRPPLSQIHLPSEEFCRKCFVRLACVKHAASVHPEPGSNSHVKSWILSRIMLGLNPFRNSSFISLDSWLFFETFLITRIKNFRVLVIIPCPFLDDSYFESFKVVSLFNYQGSLFCLLTFRASANIILSNIFAFVNRFFKTFFKKNFFQKKHNI